MTDTTPADERHWTPINLAHLSKTDLRHVRAYAEAFAEHKQARAASTPEPAQEPVGWLTSPHGAFKSNPLYKLTGPHSLAWDIPLYAAPLSDQARQDRIMELARRLENFAFANGQANETPDRSDKYYTKHADAMRDAFKALEAEVRKP
jgi:hypothetical protein